MSSLRFFLLFRIAHRWSLWVDPHIGSRRVTSSVWSEYLWSLYPYSSRRLWYNCINDHGLYKNDNKNDTNLYWSVINDTRVYQRVMYHLWLIQNPLIPSFIIYLRLIQIRIILASLLYQSCLLIQLYLKWTRLKHPSQKYPLIKAILLQLNKPETCAIDPFLKDRKKYSSFS